MPNSISATLDNRLVRQKLKYILADLARLNTLLKKHTYESLITDDVDSTLAERWVERMINRAIDINLHIIRAQQLPPPDTYAQSFIELGKLKVLSTELANQLFPCVGTRNILVHDYDDLDAVKFFSALEASSALFPKYAAAIERYLESSQPLQSFSMAQD